MSSLVLCYAAPDEPAARQLGDFLSANLPLDIAYGEGVIRPELDLLAAADRALSADFGLILLSPDSVPTIWNRADWEPLLSETRLAFALLRDCNFPKLLRRRRFFDLSTGFLPGARAARNWLLRPDRPVARHSTHDVLQEQIGDKPGVAADISIERATAFADACQADFESVYVIDATDRTRAGMVGDIGHALGLTLPGSCDENQAELIHHCRERRYLIVYKNVHERDRSFLALGGRASVVFASPSATIPRSREEIDASFFAVPRDERLCETLLRDAAVHMRELLPREFDAGLRLGWAVVSILKSARRFAETIETLAVMRTAAHLQGNQSALFKIEWEQSWLQDDSGNHLSNQPVYNGQLSLPFA